MSASSAAASPSGQGLGGGQSTSLSPGSNSQALLGRSLDGDSSLSASSNGMYPVSPNRSREIAESSETDGDDEDGADGEGEDEEDEDVYTREDAGFSGRDLIVENSIKSGYLWKKGEKRKTWKKRWFVLRTSKLAYYKNEKEYQLLRLIDMSEVHTVASVEMKRNENSFGIVTPRRTYYVKASSRQEMQDWIQRLNEVKTQLSQSTTLTQDLAKTRLSDLSPLSDRTNTTAALNAGAIPGIGIQSSAAQPQPIPSLRTSPSSGAAGLYAGLSPRTATSDSESSETAAKYGLSYASSATSGGLGAGAGASGSAIGSVPAGPSSLLSSSPGVRSATHDRLSSGGYSAQSHSGGELSDARSGSRRERSVSSGGGGYGAGAVYQSYSPGQPAGGAGGIVSSSEEEDWDEDEGADQAMPLPALTPGGQNLQPQQVQLQQLQLQQLQQQPQLQLQQPTPTASRSSASDFLKDPSRVLLQGYLMKQSSRRKHWRKRWFVLTSSKLMYTRSHMDAKAHRQIPVSSMLDAIEYESKKAFKETSSPLTSPTTNKTFNFGSFGEAAEVSAAIDGDEDLSGGNIGAVDTDGAAPAQIERRSSMIAAAAGVASSVGAGVVGSTGVGGGGRKKKENCFRIITPKRNFLICAPSEEEEIKWLSTLQTLISRVRDAKDEEEKAKLQATASVQSPVHGFQTGSNSTTAAPRGSSPSQGISTPVINAPVPPAGGSRRTRSISSNSGTSAS